MIRKFTKQEQVFIKKLLTYRKEGKDFKMLQSSRLIRCELNILAVKYNENSISLYAPAKSYKKIDIGNSIEILGRKFESCVGITNNDIDESWMYRLADLLSLLQELEDNRYITISRPNRNDSKTDSEFFDRDEYESLIEEKEKLPKLKLKGKEEYIELLSATFNGDIAEQFYKYGTGIIFPLASLLEFADNDFLSIEQRNSNRENRNVWLGIVISIVVAIATPLISTICQSDVKINEAQLEKIDSIFRKAKTEFPKQIEVTTQDTIKVVTIKKQTKK